MKKCYLDNNRSQQQYTDNMYYVDYWQKDTKKEISGNVLLSREVALQVSSALRSLTSVFGMGTGVSSPL